MAEEARCMPVSSKACFRLVLLNTRCVAEDERNLDNIFFDWIFVVFLFESSTAMGDGLNSGYYWTTTTSDDGNWVGHGCCWDAKDKAQSSLWHYCFVWCIQHHKKMTQEKPWWCWTSLLVELLFHRTYAERRPRKQIDKSSHFEFRFRTLHQGTFLIRQWKGLSRTKWSLRRRLIEN